MELIEGPRRKHTASSGAEADDCRRATLRRLRSEAQRATVFAPSSAPVELKIIRNGKASGLKPGVERRVCKLLGVDATVNRN